MSFTPEGLCAVCGVETTQRCSSCAEHGFDLFLCGREHQKLVWFAHKRVCGENANPFTFPLLSLEKAKDIKEHLDEPATLSGSSGPTTRGQIREALFCFKPFATEEEYVDSVTANGLADQQDLSTAFPMLSLLRACRASQSAVSVPLLTPELIADPLQRAAFLHRRDPFGTIAMFFNQMLSRLPRTGKEGMRTLEIKGNGYTTILHQLLVVAAVEYRCRQRFNNYYAAADRPVWEAEPADVSILRGYIAGQHQAMQRVLDTVRAEDSAFANVAAQELANQTVFRDFGLAFDGWVRVVGAGGRVEKVKQGEEGA